MKTACSSWPRTPRGPCTRSARSTTGSPSAGSAATTSTTSCEWPACATRTPRASPSAGRTSTHAALANLYAQYLHNVFTHEMKPLEVEILVAELSEGDAPDQLYHVAYEGTITDEERFAVLGGDAETITERVERSWQEGWDLSTALAAAAVALAGPDRTLAPDDLEVAVLSRHNGRQRVPAHRQRGARNSAAGRSGRGGSERSARRRRARRRAVTAPPSPRSPDAGRHRGAT